MGIVYRLDIWIRLALLLVLSVFYACKKSPFIPDDLPVSPSTGSRIELTLDSIYLYAKQTYLWNEALPAYEVFKPRQYQQAEGLSAFNAVVFSLSQLKINPLTGAAYERSFNPGQAKYSFIQASANRSFAIAGLASKLAAVSLTGQGADMGINIAAFGAEVYISYVNPASPAANSGLTRGCRILKINGQAATLSIAQNAIGGNDLELEVAQTDGSLLQTKLSKTNYQSNPVLKTAILSAGHEQVGYIALSDFNTLSSSKTTLDQSFNQINGASVATVIVDLRYNKGGYVETAAYVANLIANSSLNGKTMYVERYHTNLQQGKATYLKNQPYFDEHGNPVYLNGKRATLFNVDYTLSGNTYTFAKKGSMEGIRNVYFIVTEQTASASEMLINCLKPYLNVKLIGKQTYGKPVGFFGINIDQYTLYVPNFKIENAKGEGDYFNGFTPDLLVSEDLTKDFADPKEACISAALSLLAVQPNTQPMAKVSEKSSQESNSLSNIQAPKTSTLNTFSNGLSSGSKSLQRFTFLESRTGFSGLMKRNLKLN